MEKKTEKLGTTVDSAAGLWAALQNPDVQTINVSGRIDVDRSLRLSPGQKLAGSGAEAELNFVADTEGVELTTDNEIQGLALHVRPDLRAVFNDTGVSDLDKVMLADVSTIGQVQILAEGQVRRGHVEVRGLDIIDADTTGRENAYGYGVVDARQGAFTLWNRQQDAEVVLTAELIGITVGREGSPVRGGGVFVSGAGDNSRYFSEQKPVGRLNISVLETGAIYNDGRIPPGTAKLISGGVFVLYGATVDLVRNVGTVTTYGPNDMILDNWGDVNRWTVEAGLLSYGPSGIGVVNFGGIKDLEVAGTIETHGVGARGFNVYLGFVEKARFERIVTHGDAAVGIQISQKVGKLVVRDGIQTHGGSGPSLVSGVVMQLSAMALSVQQSGEIDEVDSGTLSTEGDGLTTLDVRGRIGRMEVRGAILATGKGSTAIRVDSGSIDLHITAPGNS